MVNMIEVLKVLGYPLSSITVLVLLAYLGRKTFEKLLDSIVSRDLEIVKRQNMEALEAVKNKYTLVLEDKKAELANETERLKTSLSVEAETYRLAAQKRFQVLLNLWETSESLFTETDFSDIGATQKGV